MSGRGLIFFYGPPLVGKSTLGKAFACHIGLPFWDVDEMVTVRANSSVEDIFTECGEPEFRKWEYKVICDLCTEERGVVALGGGALIQPWTRDLVEKNGEVVLLTAPQQTLLERMDQGADTRPLLGREPEQGLMRLLETRDAHYASFPRKVWVEGKTEEELIGEVEVSLGRFRIGGMRREYEVVIRPDCLDEMGQAMRDRDLNGPVVVITDDQVGRLYAERVMIAVRDGGYPCSLCVFPAGERSKTMETVRDVWRHFLSAEVERGSTVVALGGGVAGDLAGFAAAAFHRGIQWINIPTSLLAMVDASLGGKTGVNLPQGKNLVGAFHPPRQVWVDPDVLCTLPMEELESGMAEVIKHGVISDPVLFSLAGEGREGVEGRWEELITRAIGVKAKIVRLDPYEQDQRRILNFGHTIGHGVEHASNYRLKHGEAVAIGMVAETYLSERLGLAPPGLTKKLEDVLSLWNLPLTIPSHLPEEDIMKAMRRDKKVAGGKLRFSLPFDLGDVKPGIKVEEKDWREALRFRKESTDG